jgi:nucleoid-associated protein YgaU
VRAQRRRGAGVARPGATAVLAGLVTAAVVALALVGLAHLLGADAAASGPASTAQSSPAAGGASPSAPVEASAGAPTAASAVADHVVVAPGDTLWSIARTLQPSGDVRPLVDRLAARAGGPVLAVGQRIDVTGLA